jgi:hypothetical protein
MGYSYCWFVICCDDRDLESDADRSKSLRNWSLPQCHHIFSMLRLNSSSFWNPTQRQTGSRNSPKRCERWIWSSSSSHLLRFNCRSVCIQNNRNGRGLTGFSTMAAVFNELFLRRAICLFSTGDWISSISFLIQCFWDDNGRCQNRNGSLRMITDNLLNATNKRILLMKLKW